jgi:translation initiation factor 2 subunit 2
MTEKYKEQLDELYEKVKVVETSTRFEIPKATGHVEGNKTIVDNFQEICNILRRDCSHVAKYLSRELATQATINKGRIIFNRKLQSARINEKIRAYADEFVICRECKKPDTELIKEDRLMFVHCLACGAKHPVRAKIQ